MKCQHCQFDNPPAAKFCGQCGAKQGALCPDCGAAIPPGFRFCGECGVSLGLPAATPPEPGPENRRPAAAVSYTPSHLAEQVLTSRTALEGERKQVTVLFCDLVSSTALADRLGPEIMHGLLSRFFELALGEVHRYGGTINQFLGDGFMALFGAPVAYEDHARRAVLAAVGLGHLLAERRDELGGAGASLTVRMGLNTGQVVVGGIGDRLRMDYTAVGDTTNLAARLQQLATPGAILVSEATARLVGEGVRLEPLPPAVVKGKTEPVRAFRVLGVERAAASASPLPGALSPFVGRERELDVLEELLEQAAAGQGQVVGIAGEAGSGKSRLLAEMRRRRSDGVESILVGRCLSYGAGVPYLPLLHLLRVAWGIADADGPEAVAAKTAAGLSAMGVDPDEPAPYFLHLFGLEQDSGPLAGLSPQALQGRLFGALRQAFLAAARERPLVLAIEDLHWVDETSEQFLASLVESLAAARVLLVLTYRSGYQPRWMDKSYATQITMRRLAPGDSRAVVAGVLRRAELPEELARLVLEKAEGNPFFLEELTRSLVERGAWADLSVPDTIQGVLMARIDRLPEGHKRLLQTAAVLGREFPLGLLGSIWDRGEPLDPILADLARWEFVHQLPAAAEPLFQFKHALTQEAVYQSLLTARRQGLHGAAGSAIEALHGERLEEVCDGLAHHFARAAEPARAVRYLALSAAKAARGYAHAEAAKALREALGQAAHLPPPERDRRRLELALDLAESLLPLARFHETLALLEEHRGRLAEVEEPALAGRYHFWLAHTHSYLGSSEAAAASAEPALAAARQAGDLATEGKTRYVLSRDAFWTGRFAAGIEHGLAAVDLLDRSGELWWEGQAHGVAGFHHYVLGRFDAALESMARQRAIWQALEDPRLDPSWSTGYFLASLGEWERGIEECRGGYERARDPLNSAVAEGFLGHAYMAKGDLPRAVEALEKSVRELRQSGMRQLFGWFSAFLGEALLATGRPGDAREVAEEGLAAARESGFGYGEGLVLRTLGRIARAAGDGGEAERRLGEARETFAALGVPYEVARTRLDLAALAGDRGDRGTGELEDSEARRLLLGLGLGAQAEPASTSVPVSVAERR